MPDIPPPQRLAQMIVGNWLTQAVYVAAKLGLADLVKDGPRGVDDLARATQTNPRALFRLLRALASFGVFAETPDGRFTQTPVSEPLRSDVPGSMRALALMNGEEQYQAWSGLLESVRTGETAFDKVIGKPVFDWLSERPEKAAIFDQAMVSIHGREAPAVADAYPFEGVNVLADIGGGNGSLLTTILQRHPRMRGVLFDLPGVIERAEPGLAASGLGERCRAVSGSFFESVPAGADAYMMRHIIHDWDDDRSVAILGAVRRAMGDDARLLVIETVIPPGNEPCFGKLLDVTMLVVPGGMERTEAEYRALFARAGFALTRIVPTSADVSVIEGKKA